MPRARTVVPCGSPCNGSTIMYAVLARKYVITTKPTPSPSERGTLRRGCLISPAVKVTLFHASQEKSEPTCTTASTTIDPTRAIGPSTPTCTGCSECQPALRQNSLQL